jgi:hypothetical protein
LQGFSTAGYRQRVPSFHELRPERQNQKRFFVVLFLFLEGGLRRARFSGEL